MQKWKVDISKPLVSICCITYNHEPYIEDALEGFLIQETDFPFEILIHDDASTDRTAEIIQNWEANYPSLIKPIYQNENQYSKGKNPNIFFNYARAKGKYIAFCEGDDYWIDKLKLQKQIDFLNANPDYALIHTDYNEEYVKTNKRKRMNIYKQRHLDNKVELTFDDLLIDNLIDTPTVCVRRTALQDAIRSLSSNTTTFLMGDYPLWLEISRNNRIYRFNEPTATYRILAESASHSNDIRKRFHFIASSYDIKYFFLSKYGCSSKIINIVNSNYSQFLIRYAFLLNNKQLALKAVNIKGGLSFLEIKDKLLYYGTTNNVIRLVVKIIRKSYSLLKRIKYAA
jgi:glycosyltransferase involved in cell wall biosynthesis